MQYEIDISVATTMTFKSIQNTKSVIIFGNIEIMLPILDIGMIFVAILDLKIKIAL